MKTFDDIEALWKSTPATPLPDAGEMIKKALKQKKILANKILLQVFCLLAALVSMMVVMCKIEFQFTSSYIGLGLMMLCIVVFSAVRFRQSQFLKKANFSQSPSVLLLEFEKFYLHQKWVNTKGTLIYTIALNIAFAFYFYETLVVPPISIFWKILFLVVYITWMLIATLWIGKRHNRKEHARTEDIIGKLKEMQKSLEV
ncbi:hypothetical protein [Ferruginibacter sp. HRS2-29]|uniref:hypothetical protein n=1 Tax=Ferruginibacter sp. HRS2-29 TaxID=2487334 RepID=UPI0020CBEACD|nr:hypothetical protein [Ferruginibacter sp. HRS2-29]MCP9750420.1 hypothetical protein [Ferruginibacter sp. HRS2-29]